MNSWNGNGGLRLEVKQPLLSQYKKTGSQVRAKTIFRVSNEDLQLFFERKNLKVPDNKGESRISLNILKECGYQDGLCGHIGTDIAQGIVGDKPDILRRQKLYGTNSIPLPTVSTFYTLLCRNFEDTNVVFLIWAATAYLIFSFFSTSTVAYVEALTIYCGVMFSALISAFCDWKKEQQFLVLKDEINNQEVLVYRGGYGTCMSIPVREIVVGDIIDIQQGDRIPADCLLVEEQSVTVDETIYNKKNYSMAKETSEVNGLDAEEPDNHKSNPDPFLLCNSMVLTGQGKALVLCVGDNTRLAKSRQPEDLEIQEQQTLLEARLDDMSVQIGKYAMVATLLCVVSHSAFLILRVLFDPNMSFLTNDFLLAFMKIIITATVLLIVAIPEGLPLAISIAMALSVGKLKEDQILIKNLEAIQNCAIIHEVGVSKTGVLTKGELSVKKFHLADQKIIVENTGPNFFKDSLSLHQNIKNLIVESIISNSDVRMEINDETMQSSPKGSAIEEALVQLLIDNSENIQLQLQHRNSVAPVKVLLPFDNEYKRKVYIRAVEGNPEIVRIYTKGAPEIIIRQCTKTLDNAEGTEKDFLEEEQSKILNEDAQKNIYSMAAEGFKVLSFAYKDIQLSELEELLKVEGGDESKEFRESIEKEFIYLATVGFDDPFREDIKEKIKQFKYEGDQDGKVDMNIRLISSDHFQTVKYAALELKIVDPDWYKESKSDATKYCIMHSDEFRKLVGSYEKIWNQDEQKFKLMFKSNKNFKHFRTSLKVIARASSEDKLVFVNVINMMGGLIGMSGDSISDSLALKDAPVGFCMGQGCDVTKDASDMIIKSGSFEAIYKSIKWGRFLFSNIRNFLTFQLTLNIVLCFNTIIGGIFTGRAPLNVVQMLWSNLIMDILAAITLGTEPYTPNEGGNRLTRISRKDNIMLMKMWKSILSVALYQIFWILLLTLFGSLMFFDGFNIVSTPIRDPQTQAPTDRMKLDTIIFHTFIVMNLCNQISCKLCDFQIGRILSNPIFWFVFLIECAVQALMISAGKLKLGQALLGVTSLTTGQHIFCIIVGVLIIPYSFIMNKFVPDEKFQFTDKFNIENEDENTYVSQILSKVKSVQDQPSEEVKEEEDQVEKAQN